EVQNDVGRAAGRRSADEAVEQRLAGDVVTGFLAASELVHDQPSGGQTDLLLLWVDRRDGGHTRGRDAHDLQRRRHRVGGELSAAGALTRAGDAFELQQVLVADLAGGVRADALEDVLNGDVAP